MKSNYVILKNKELVLETYSGIVTLEEFEMHKQAVENDPKFSPNYTVLSDMRQAVLEMPSSDQVLINPASEILNSETGVWLHKASKNVYEMIEAQFKTLFPIKEIYSVYLEDILKHFNINYLKSDIEKLLDKLHKLPKVAWK